MTADSWSTGVAANLSGLQLEHPRKQEGLHVTTEGLGIIQITASVKLCPWVPALEGSSAIMFDIVRQDAIAWKLRLHQLVQGPGMELFLCQFLSRHRFFGGIRSPRSSER